MPERLGYLSDASEPLDDGRMGFHCPDVRSQRTLVNGENVRGICDPRGMADTTVGEKLAALRARSEMTMDDVAKALGLSGRSSVQRFFAPHLDTLSVDDALRLADVFAGKGQPPIERREVLIIAGIDNLVEVAPNPALAPRYLDLPRDVPVYGTAMGSLHTTEGQQEVEQTYIDSYDVLDHWPRLPSYANRSGIYGLYVTGSSMEPRWDPGDPAYVDPKRPPQIGDDVVVYLVKTIGEDHEPEAVLIKRLVKRSASFVELEQYNPAMTFRVEVRRIKALHRVIPRREHNGAK